MGSNTKSFLFTALPLILLSLTKINLMHVKTGPLTYVFTQSVEFARIKINLILYLINYSLLLLLLFIIIIIYYYYY